jgi:hypothetical protein
MDEKLLDMIVSVLAIAIILTIFHNIRISRDYDKQMMYEVSVESEVTYND